MFGTSLKNAYLTCKSNAFITAQVQRKYKVLSIFLLKILSYIRFVVSTNYFAKMVTLLLDHFALH